MPASLSTEPVSYNEIPSYGSGTEHQRRDHSWLKVGAGFVGILLFVGWIGHTPPLTDASPVSPHAEIQNSNSSPVEVAPVAVAARDQGNAGETVVVLASEYIRDGASRRGKVVGHMHQNDHFTEFARSGDWVQIGHNNPIGLVGAPRLGR